MLHTHYDNLKVARRAPQEVIRAAYKALSQKYHPDKNPGDAKAAHVMAMLNSAYGILADPQRRREHDEWIAAEEWESQSQVARQEALRHSHPSDVRPIGVARSGRGRLLLAACIGVCIGVGIGLWIGLGWPEAIDRQTVRAALVNDSTIGRSPRADDCRADCTRSDTLH